MKTNIIIGLALAVCVSAILAFAGVLDSGFHFKDDIGILGSQKAAKADFGEYVKYSVKRDLNIRFRPMRNFLRSVKIYLFGENFGEWYLYNSILMIVTVILLFAFARAIGFSGLAASIFSFLSIFGEQGAIWCRLGLAEPEGYFFLSAALFFLGLSIRSKKRSWTNEIFFLLFVTLSSLCKESFILFIPAVVFLKLWLDPKRGRAFPSVLLIVIMIAELFYIKNTVNLSGEVNFSLNIYQSVLNFISSPLKISRNMKFDLLFIFDLLFGCLIIMGMFFVVQSEIEDSGPVIKKAVKLVWERFGKMIVFILIALIPQVILYNKTGLAKRFWVPAVLSLSFPVAYLLNMAAASEKITRFTKKVFIILIFLVLIPRVGHTYFRMSVLTSESDATEKFINKALSPMGIDEKILIAADPVANYEAAYVMRTLLNRKGIKSYEYLFIDNANEYLDEETSRRLKADVQKQFNAVDLVSDNNFTRIAVFPGIEKKLEDRLEGYIDLEKYKKEKFGYFEGDFIVYSKK